MRFVTLFQFTEQGVSKIRDTTKRAKAFEKQASAAGVKIHDILWTQGQYDGVAIFEADTAESAAAMMLTLGSKGNIKTHTMVAFNRDEMDRVLAKIK